MRRGPSSPALVCEFLSSFVREDAARQSCEWATASTRIQPATIVPVVVRLSPALQIDLIGAGTNLRLGRAIVCHRHSLSFSTKLFSPVRKSDLNYGEHKPMRGRILFGERLKLF
jgi:hypothetical protein